MNNSTGAPRQRSSRTTIRSAFVVQLHVLLILASTASFGAVGAPDSLERAIPDKVIYVNNQHPHAGDWNGGDDSERPIKTIGHAAEMAMKNQERGFSSKIVIYPGMYREQIKLDFGSRKRSPPIIFEAKEKGTVIVSGSDVWDDWKRIGETDVYVHDWPHKWGFMPGPSQLSQKYGPIVRRREMIFFNGAMLEQVLSEDHLKPGTFYISEEDSKAYLRPPSEQILGKGLVEVAVRSDIFEATRARNLVLRGLTFQHDTTGMSTLGSAVHFKHSNNILIEDCKIVWNNWFGLRFTDIRNVTTRRNTASYNGGAGWVGWKIKDLMSEDDETSYNNWRGGRGNFLGWEIAGVKHHAVHDAIYRRHRAAHNQTRGLWLDYDNSNVVVEEACWCGNLTDGMNIEASQGPITIRKSHIYRNQSYGITSDSSRVILEENAIYGNGRSQIKQVFGNNRQVNNWETGENLRIDGTGWMMRKNTIASDSQASLLELAGGDRFFGGAMLEANVWHKPDQKDLFKVNKRSVSVHELENLMGRQTSVHGASEKLRIDHDGGDCH